MFECRRLGKKSAVDFFNDDEDLRRGVLKMLSLYGKASRAKLREICRNESASSRINNFPPVVAKSIMLEASEILQSSSLSVLDPCAGFSGRMVGCAASGVTSRYVGIDRSRKTARGLEATAAFLREVSQGTNVESFEGDCLDVMPALGEFDVILTSPPFFNLEEYVGVPSPHDYQCWLQDFVSPFVSACYDALSPEGRMFLYVEPVGRHDLLADFARLAKDAGFKANDPLSFNMARGEYRRPGGAMRTVKILAFGRE
jgi:hypothetical protein